MGSDYGGGKWQPESSTGARGRVGAEGWRGLRAHGVGDVGETSSVGGEAREVCGWGIRHRLVAGRTDHSVCTGECVAESDHELAVAAPLVGRQGEQARQVVTLGRNLKARCTERRFRGRADQDLAGRADQGIEICGGWWGGGRGWAERRVGCITCWGPTASFDSQEARRVRSPFVSKRSRLSGSPARRTRTARKKKTVPALGAYPCVRGRAWRPGRGSAWARRGREGRWALAARPFHLGPDRSPSPT